MLLATPSSITTPLALCRLWMHETTRVLTDRFYSEEELQWFVTTAAGIMTREEILPDVSDAVAPSWFIALENHPTLSVVRL